MQYWVIWGAILTAVNVLAATGVTIHAVLWKRDSRAVIAWVGLVWLAPLAGAFAYVWFGINRIERKGASLKLRDACQHARDLDIDDDDRLQAEMQQPADGFAATYPQLTGLANAGQALSGLALVPGNKVEPLLDGDQAYPAMIQAIEGAQRSISLLSFIFDSDRVGDQFLAALVDAHQRKVAVRVLIDDVGSKYSRPNMVRRMKRAGLAATGFLPTRLPRLPTYANLRNHRKILVVDGLIGFTGGTNIREGHCLALQPSRPVQCLHFQLEGPVVRQLQLVFATDWEFAAGEVISGEEWFPAVSRAGTVWARGIEDGPDANFEKLADLMAAGLASARHRVRIVTPYFLPHAALIQALNVAALRGVHVEIYLPAANNVRLVQWASTAELWQVLEKGCRVFYTPPPFDHTKLMIVDDAWSLIGSTNWDPRSLRLNFEFNVECYSVPLANSLNEIIDKKAETAHEVTLAEVEGRSYPVQLRDGLARLLTPYL